MNYKNVLSKKSKILISYQYLLNEIQNKHSPNFASSHSLLM